MYSPSASSAFPRRTRPPPSASSVTSPTGKKNRSRDAKRAEERRLRGGAPAPRRTRSVRVQGSEQRGSGRRSEGGRGEMEVEQEQIHEQEVESEEEDPVWAGVREDHYKVIGQLPFELERAYTLLYQLDGQTEGIKMEFQDCVRHYINLRRRDSTPSFLSSVVPGVANDGWTGSPLQQSASDVIAQEAADVRGDEEETGRVPPVVPTQPPSSLPPSRIFSCSTPILDTSCIASSTGYTTSTSTAPARPPSILDHTSYAMTSSGPLSLPPSNLNAVNTSAHFPRSPVPPPSPPSPLSSPSRTHLLHLASLLAHLVRTSSNKVALAKDTYERVDRQVRELDLGLERHQRSLTVEELKALAMKADVDLTKESRGRKRSVGEVADAEHGDIGRGIGGLDVAVGGKGLKQSDPKADAVGENDSEALQQKQQQEAARVRGGSVIGAGVEEEGNWLLELAEAGMEGVTTTTLGKEEALVGMAVHPNEPRYCYCNGVSYGEMMACDNEDCEKEWFHLGCVGVSSPIKGSWFCADCAGAASGSARAEKKRRK